MMTEEDKNEIICEQSFNFLCHPEDMGRATLISILEERQLDIPDLNGMELVDLIQIYNSFVLPLPQREHKKQNINKLEADKLSSTFKRKALISGHNSKRIRHEDDTKSAGKK